MTGGFTPLRVVPGRFAPGPSMPSAVKDAFGASSVPKASFTALQCGPHAAKRPSTSVSSPIDRRLPVIDSGRCRYYIGPDDMWPYREHVVRA